MGLMQRRKGRAAESAFKRLLLDRDWTIEADLSAGLKTADLLATSPEGRMYLVEVKNHKSITLPYFEAQARRQAADTKRPWMLAVKVPGYDAWIVTRQDEPKIQLWRGKNEVM